jgi:hypothetical protein
LCGVGSLIEPTLKLLTLPQWNRYWVMLQYKEYLQGGIPAAVRTAAQKKLQKLEYLGSLQKDVSTSKQEQSPLKHNQKTVLF